MRNSGKFVVCDRGNERSRMQIFTKNGHFIKKIAIRYIDIVAGLAVTGQGQIVAVDSVSPTVFVISDTGALLRWFDCSDYMREPSDIAISGKFTITNIYFPICKDKNKSILNICLMSSYVSQERNISFAISKGIALWYLTRMVNSCVVLAARI